MFAFSMQLVFGCCGGQYAAYPHSVHGLVVFPSWRAVTVSAVMFPEYPAEQKQSSGLLAPGGASALSGHEEIWSPPGQLGNGDLLVKSGFGAGPADEADGVVDGLLLIAFTFIAVGDTVEHTGVERHEAGVSVDADGNGALLENFDDLGESGTGKGLCGVASLKHSALDSTVLASATVLSLVSHVAVFAGDSVGVAVADGRSGPSTIASVSGH